MNGARRNPRSVPKSFNRFIHSIGSKKSTSDYISEDIKIKTFSEVENKAKESSLPPTDIFKILFSIKDCDETCKSLQEKGCNINYIINCIKYCATIRPKQCGHLFKVLSLFTDNKDKEDTLFKSFDKMSKLFSEKGIEVSIINDDDESFLKFTKDEGFDPNGTVQINDDIPIASVECEPENKKNIFSYMQLICFFGSIKCFKVLSSFSSVDLSEVSKYSVAGGNREIIDSLKKMDVNFDNCFEVSIKFHRYEISDWLLQNAKCEVVELSKTVEYFNNYAFYFLLENMISNTPLSISNSIKKSIKTSSLGIINYLVEERYANMKERDNEGKSLLHIASEYDDADIIRYLVKECHLNVDDRDLQKRTPLHIACEKGNFNAARFLSKKGHANLEKKDLNEKTPLHVACENGYFDIVKYLVKRRKANVEEKDLHKRTALHIACEKGYLDIVKLLVNDGHANVEKKDENGRTALIISKEKGNFDIVKFLVEECHAIEVGLRRSSYSYFPAGAPVNNEESAALHFACQDGNLDLVKYLVNESHANVEGKDENGRTALHIACSVNSLDIVKYLVEECHVNVEEKDDVKVQNSFSSKPICNGRTALQIACEKGNFGICKYLVEECHAKVEEKDNDGKTALYFASVNGALDIVKFLVEEYHASFSDNCIAEGNEEIKNYLKGKCLLHETCEKCDVSAAIKLIEEENYFANQKINGKTPLHISSENNCLELVKYLVKECKANVEEKDSQNKTALTLASEKGNFDICKYLVDECDANIEAVSDKALYIASDKGNFEIVKYLVEKCHVNVGAISKRSLHVANEQGNLELVKFLVEKCHANVEEKDKNGQTALDIACHKSNIFIAKYLVEECHANVLAKEFSQSHKNLILIVKSIFDISEKTAGKIMFNLQFFMKEKENYTYIKGFIEYAIRIRPRKKKLLSDLLIRLGFWESDKTRINVFSSKDYEESIFKDDVKSFKEIIQQKTFDPQEKVFIHKSDPIYYVNNDRHVTYLQHIVFYGALNCFNFAMEQEDFDKSNLSKYAVAGGNIDIIQKLKERGESFDNCFKVAVMFHRNELWESTLKEYKMDIVYLSETQKFYNDSAFLYIYINCNTIKSCSITNAKVEALKAGSLEMVKYLNISIDEKYYGESPLHIATKYHHVDIIKYFLGIDKTFFNEPDYEQTTPLHIAANNCYLDLINTFYKEYNAKLNNMNSEAIINAVQKGSYELIEYLLFTWKVKSNQKLGLSLFSIAARRGDIDIFNLLIKYFGNEFDKEQVNKSLKIASENCNLDIIKCLIESWDADPLLISSNSLHVATIKGNTEAVKYLIEKCKVKPTKDVFGRNLLMIATEYYNNDEYMSIIEYLVEECHIDVSATRVDGRTVLHIATEKTNFGLVKYFVEECHLNIEAEDWKGITPMDIAKSKGDLDIISYLTESLESTNKPNTLQLKMHNAIEEGNLTLFKTYLDDNLLLLPPSYLNVAAEKENLDIIEYLVEDCGFDVETEDSFGRTPLFISAEKGNLNNVKYLIEELNADYETECISGKTPLHISAERGFIKVVNYLTEKCGANKMRQDKYYQTPLSLSLESHRPNITVIDYFSKESPESIKEVDFYERNLLHIAAEKKDKSFTESVKNAIISSNNNFASFLEGEDYKGKTPVCHAIEKGNIEQAKYLIEDCKASTSSIKGYLINAVDNNDFDLVKTTLEMSDAQEIETKDKYGQTPLILATQRGNLDIVKYLVEKYNADIDEEDQNNHNPLLIAAKTYNLTIFNYLLEEYIRNGTLSDYHCLDSKDIYVQYTNLVVDYVKRNLGLTKMIEDEIENNNLPLIKYLYGKCHKSVEEKDKNGKTVLHYACEKDSFDIVKYLVKECHANIEEKTEEANEYGVVKRRTALYIASENGNFDTVKYLIDECHANVETISEKSLHVAAANRNLALVKYLIEECHANIETKDESGRNVLHVACEIGDIDLVEYLVQECHLNVEEKTEGVFVNRKTALHIACAKGNIEIVKYLVEKCHANIEERDWNGSTALRVASEYCNLPLIKYLAEECNADVNGKNYDEKTALHIASEKDQLDIVKYLVEKCHVDIEDKDNQKRTALFFAYEKGNTDIIEYLVKECKANINEKDWNGKTLLHISCEKGDIKMVKYLVEECNADINERDSQERTVLHSACENGELEIAKYLIEECHSNIEEKDALKKTVLHSACEGNNLDLVKYLVETCNANIKAKTEEINSKGNIYGRTPLIVASDKENLEIVKYLAKMENIETKERNDRIKNALKNAGEELLTQCSKSKVVKKGTKVLKGFMQLKGKL